MTPLDFPPRYRMVRPAPPELLRQIELADEAFNRNPDGLLGRIGWGEVIVGMLVAFGIGFGLAVL